MSSSRAIQAMRPVLSVVIAVMAAHALGLRDTWWAAISAFVVMQDAFAASLYRGALRILGTLFGAAAGLVLGPPMGDHPVAFVLVLSCAAWGGLFASLLSRHSYAWVLALVTFVMVMCEAFSARANLMAFAEERVANIVVGTLACVFVAALAEWRVVVGWLRRDAAPSPSAPPIHSVPSLPVRGDAALHALHGALAVTLLAAMVVARDLQSFPQAMVTSIAVLIVPLGGRTSDVHVSVMQRMVQRFAGCLAAGVVAFALLPFIEQRPLSCQFVLGLGAWAGAYLQGGPPGVRYMAIQFSVAFLMVFVQDRGWTVDGAAALLRLGGVFVGIAALSLVLLVSVGIRKTVPRGM